jgi:hypothetical protein
VNYVQFERDRATWRELAESTRAELEKEKRALEEQILRDREAINKVMFFGEH